MAIKSTDGMKIINHTHLRRLDLNLLLALDALLSERNVTRAAEKLRLGQPAVSHALGKLRELLKDPLLIREGSHMVLSTRAAQLVDPLRDTLAQLQAIFTPNKTFSPAEADVTFRLGVSSHVEAVVFPQLIAHCCKHAPGAKLIASQTPRTQTLGHLDGGELDLAIGVYETDKSWHRTEELFTEGFSVVFDPAFGQASQLRNFLARPHALVTTQADLAGRLDAILARHGHSRRVLYSTPNFLTLAQVLPGTPLVACVPESFACIVVGRSLSVVAPPLDICRFRVSMIWHARDDASPAHAWLREEVRRAAAVRVMPKRARKGRIYSANEIDEVLR